MLLPQCKILLKTKIILPICYFVVFVCYIVMHTQSISFKPHLTTKYVDLSLRIYMHERKSIEKIFKRNSRGYMVLNFVK